MRIPCDWNDKPNPVPSGLLFTHNKAMQRLEKALALSPETMQEIQKSGLDCLSSSDYLGHQYFQMMLSVYSMYSLGAPSF